MAASPSIPGDRFHFDAFISYSRRDAVFARALEKALEAYRPPRDLEAPQRHLKVFRDEEDFQGGEYSGALTRNLERSAKLLVICSPRSAVSTPVNDEIRLFAERRGADNIISVMLDGIPNNEIQPGQESRQAFPPELMKYQVMPLANSYLGFDHKRDRVDRGAYLPAWHKTLADIYGIDRDLLERREQRRRAARRRIVTAATATLLTVLSALTIWAWIERGIARQQRDIARDQRDTAQSRALASSANLQLQRDPELSLLLAIEAAKRKPTPEAVTALRAALHESRVRRVMTWDRTANVRRLAADGRRALSIEGEMVRVLDLDSGRPAYSLRAPGHAVAWADFAEDSQYVLTVDDSNTARVWHQEQMRAAFDVGHWDAIVTSGDATLVAVVDATQVHLWSTSARRKLWSRASLIGRVSSVAFDHQARMIGIGGITGASEIRTVATGSVLSRLAQPRSAAAGPIEPRIAALAFSPDSHWVVTASWDNVARLWRVADGRLFSDFRDHTDALANVRFSQDGKYVVTASADGTAKAWERDTRHVVADFRGHQSALTDAAFCRDASCVITIATDGTAREWETGLGRSLGACESHGSETAKLAVSRDGRYAATGDLNGTVKVHEMAGCRTMATFPEDGSLDLVEHESVISGLTFSPDGARLAASSWDGTVRIWDVPSATAPLRIAAPGVTGVAFNEDGRLLVTAGFGDAGTVWDAATGKPLAHARIDQPEPSATRRAFFLRNTAAVAPRSGLAATTTPDDTVIVWQPATGKIVAEMPGRTVRDARRRLLTSMAFSPDGERLVTWRADIVTSSRDREPDIGDVVAKIWDVPTGRLVAELTGHDRPVTRAVFSPNGDLVATASIDGTARLFDAREGHAILTLKGHADFLSDVAFSPNGQVLATASGDRTVRLWQVATGTAVEVFHGEDAFLTVEFVSNGEAVVATGVDGSVRVLPCVLCGAIDDLLRLAGLRAKRDLSAEERKRYLEE